LTRLECRVTPMRRQAAATLVKFDDFFALPDVERIPLSAAVLDRATAIRANYSYKTLDAIHLAAAVEAGCGVFLTNDSRLHGFPDIAVEVLQ